MRAGSTSQTRNGRKRAAIPNASPSEGGPAIREPEARRLPKLKLFLASCLSLYFEVVIIRYLSSEVPVFAYLKNLSLVAIFLGIGLGMVLGRIPRDLIRIFPFITVALFLLISFASPLGLTHLPFPNVDYFVWGSRGNFSGTPLSMLLRYLVAILGFLALLVFFFSVLGGLMAEKFSQLPALVGYGINLAGSLTGVVIFTALSVFALPPVVWMIVGFSLALPFFFRVRLMPLVFLIIVSVMGWPDANVFWSPYYRISLERLPSPPDWPHPSAWLLTVNYDYHQTIVNLSQHFMAYHADVEFYRSAYASYELPYQFVPRPDEVLVVGAGTGNDVAAALRHGATHVDAVEIDPLILKLGREVHPERPYNSPHVTLYVDDARAFFKKVRKKYDVIVFGYLDSHTLLTSFSSLRLDNYVYTLESFQEARSLLREGGSLFLGFSSGQTFVSDRLFATLTRAFGVEPEVYFMRGANGVVFLEGKARETATPVAVPKVTDQLRARANSEKLATDRWPFLYLKAPTIPISILIVLIPFLCGSLVLLQRTTPIRRKITWEDLHFFFLGAGFLLLETKGVTELSLLFGSTWVVNAVVISAFLVMALLANALVTSRPVSLPGAYGCLFALLAVGTILPYALLESFPAWGKVLAGGALVSLPVFFSGLIFSSSFRDAPRPAEALGINLLGAVVGGVLENTVMVGGTPILGGLVILLYVLAGLCAIKARPGQALPAAIEKASSDAAALSS